MSIASSVSEAYAKEFKGASIVLGHSPKSNEDTLSGSGILENNSFALIGLNKVSNGLREMKVLRIKDAPEDSYSRFEIKGQRIPGLDKKGNPRSGGVVVYRGGTTDAGQGLLERQEAAKVEAEILVEDLSTYLAVGEHGLDDVTQKCKGKSVGSYNWLPGSYEPDRKMPGRSSLHGKIMALAGSVWPLRNGTHELEVERGTGKGPGSGSKVIIRKLLPGN